MTAVDRQMKAAEDAPTIGLLLCKSKDKVVAEYTLRDSTKPMGVAEYQLVQALPPQLETSLPSIEQIESELGESERPRAARPTRGERSSRSKGRKDEKRSAGWERTWTNMTSSLEAMSAGGMPADLTENGSSIDGHLEARCRAEARGTYVGEAAKEESLDA